VSILLPKDEFSEETMYIGWGLRQKYCRRININEKQSFEDSQTPSQMKKEDVIMIDEKTNILKIK
jgi:hypothetical protein